MAKLHLDHRLLKTVAGTILMSRLLFLYAPCYNQGRNK